jgi:glycerol uptake facilitator-like aquaporin
MAILAPIPSIFTQHLHYLKSVTFSITLHRPNSIQKIAACSAFVASAILGAMIWFLGADKDANTSPTLSLTIIPTLVFMFSLSMQAASQFTLKKPFKWGCHLMFLGTVAASSEYCRALALQKASNDSAALLATMEGELTG